jgi:hypothetical protein
MTTKAGRVQPKDVRQGKTLWQVTIEEDNHPDPFTTPTYSAFITPVFPVTLAFSITDNINTGFFFYHKWITGALEMAPLSGLDLAEEEEDGVYLTPTLTAFFKSKKAAEKYVRDTMLLGKHLYSPELDTVHMPLHVTFAERGPVPDIGERQRVPNDDGIPEASINIADLQALNVGLDWDDFGSTGGEVILPVSMPQVGAHSKTPEDVLHDEIEETYRQVTEKAQQRGVEKANELFALQEKENDGRGVTCVRDIVNNLIRKDINGAKMLTDHDWDKVANYPAIAQWLKDHGFADANAYVIN